MYDVIVIGGGAGGYAGAIRAAQLGGKVAVVERAKLGGVCVNRGCIPTKTWLKAAETLRTVRNAAKYGVRVGKGEVDYATIRQNKNDCCSKIKMGMESLLANNGVEIFNGHAAFKDARTLDVDGTGYQAKHFIVATGSRVVIPAIEGLEKALLSTDEVLDLEAAPQSVLVVGDDTIAVEMAQLLRTLGSEVILATENGRILPQEDADSSQRLSQALKEEGIEILTRYSLTGVKASRRKFSCTLSGRENREVVVEKVLCSPRAANTEGLEPANAALRCNEDGSIKVNERLQTSTPNIYAIGDVTGGSMQSHAASAMAVVAAENCLGRASVYDPRLVPRGTWTSPQVASVGLTEEEAEEKDLEIDVGYFPYSINGYSISRGETFGAVKIVADEAFRIIYGVHIVGPNATELIGEASLAMQLEYTTTELAQGIRVHPSFSEAVVDAARDAEKWALYLPKK